MEISPELTKVEALLDKTCKRTTPEGQQTAADLLAQEIRSLSTVQLRELAHDNRTEHQQAMANRTVWQRFTGEVPDLPEVTLIENGNEIRGVSVGTFWCDNFIPLVPQYRSESTK